MFFHVLLRKPSELTICLKLVINHPTLFIGLPRWLSGKESACPCRKLRFAPRFLSRKSHGQRSLVGYSPQGHKKSHTAEQLNTHTFFIIFLHCIDYTQQKQPNSVVFTITSFPRSLRCCACQCIPFLVYLIPVHSQ